MTPKALTSALQGAFFDQLDAAVAAGKLTQAQANAIKQRIEQSGGIPRFDGFPPFGLHAFGGPHALGIRGHGELGAAAKYLGLTNEQLLQQLSSGKTLAQIAAAKGKSTSGLKDAMLAAIKSKLDRGVANKMLTGQQEQQIVSQLSAHLDDLINGKLPAPPRFGLRPFFLPRGAAGPGVPMPYPGPPPGSPAIAVPAGPPPVTY